MKERNQAACDRRRIDGTAAVAAVLQIALLAGCAFLDRSGLVADYRFTVSATIQSSDGLRSVVSSENLAEFSPGDPPLFGETSGSDELVARSYTSYLRAVLGERESDPAFRDVYGRGPWCVVDVHMARTDIVIEEDDESRVYAGDDPLPSCDCGEACAGNVPPLQGVLSIAPTEPARPSVVDFGEVGVLSSHEREVTLRNVGDGSLCLNAPQVDAASSEHPGDFSVTPISGCEATPAGLVLGVGTECRVRAAFTPREPGPRSARIPTLRGCGSSLTLEGIGVGGVLGASPAPACFTRDAGQSCKTVRIRVDNTPGGASVSLSGLSVTGTGPGGWEALGIEDASGTPVDLAVDPLLLGPGDFATAIVRACDGAAVDSTLRIAHNGRDYGRADSTTGDVDSGSPLAVRLRSPVSGCTP